MGDKTDNRISNSVTARRNYTFSKQGVQAALALHIIFLLLFICARIPQLVLLNVLSLIAYFYMLRLVKQRRHDLTNLLASVEITLHALIVSLYIGWDSGFNYYFLIVAPLVAFNTYRSRSFRLIVASIAIAGYLLVDHWARHQVPLIQIPDFYIDSFHTLNTLIFLVVLTYLVYVYTRRVETAEKHYYQIATTDLLTGLKNRRHMSEIASHEIARMDRAAQPLSLLICDIDHFKKVNDKYGHECGDFVLKQVAQRLIYGLRAHDVLARWGGEEFLAMLPNADIAAAKEIAERLRQLIAEPSFKFNQHEFNITMTFGVRQFSHDESFDECVSGADKALYEGKRSGRNRVELSQ